MNAKHTPTPWLVYATKTGPFYSTIEIWDGNQNALTEDSAVHIANAKFVQLAVNSHDILLKRIKKQSIAYHAGHGGKFPFLQCEKLICKENLKAIAQCE